MADPLSVSASIVSLISLGIQVSQGLVEYYVAYRSQESDVSKTVSNFENLLETFQILDRALKSRPFQSNEQALIANIEDSIQTSSDLILELEFELKKFAEVPNVGIKHAIQTAGRRLAYPFRRSTLQKLEEDVGEIRENLSLALEVLQLNDSKNVQDDLAEIKLVVELVRKSQVSHDVQAWLKAPDVTIEHNMACAKRHTSTGLWFVQGSAFANWLEKDHSFLWLHGFAGCGKSVLCSTAIQYTFRRRRSNPEIGIAFFYFSFKDSSKQNVAALLRAVLSQLSSQVQNGCVDLARLHASYRQGEPPVPVLAECVRLVIGKFRHVYLIVDALDECPRDGSRECLLEMLSDFRNWSLSELHLLVTSRDEVDIREQLGPSSSEDVSMENAGVDKDIDDFIRGHLDQNRSLRKWSEHHNRIREALTAKAHGVFRWVECQFKSLASCPRSEDHLERLLTSLPQSLGETYERMLLNVDTESVEYARRILTWLCFSKRPLTVPELIDAVAVELGPKARLDRKRRLQDDSDLLQICPGLITVATDPKYRPHPNDTSRPARVVSIAHFSVQEYLESDRLCYSKAVAFSMRHTTASMEIAQTCLVYLCDSALSQVDLTSAVLKDLPLAPYSAKYWYQHISPDESSFDRIRPYFMRLLDGGDYRFNNSIRISNPERWLSLPFEDALEEIASPIYYLSSMGLYPALRELLESRKEQNSSDSDHDKVLCDASALINAQGGDYGCALQVASLEGHERVVQLLLDEGAQVNQQGGIRGNALQAASAHGHEKVVQLLLQRGAEINKQGGYPGNALQAASANGHERTLQLLLHWGAEIIKQGGHADNALQAASRYGNSKVIKVLLEHGAEIDRSDGRYGSALQVASTKGHETVIKLLLEHGADVNVKGGEFGGALQAALATGHNRIACLLLSSIMGKVGHTPHDSRP